MNLQRLAKLCAGTIVPLAVLFLAVTGARSAIVTTAKQQSLQRWRQLTSPTAEAPRVFVKGNHIQFYFQSETNVIGFAGSWSHLRIPPDGYAVSSGLLRWDKSLSDPPDGKRGWREAAVIGGAAWRSFATNLIESLTPKSPGHGVYYQALLADRVLYRDAQGNAHVAPQGEQPDQVIVDHRFPLEETIQVLADWAEKYRAEKYLDETLLLLMPPSGPRVSQPLLVDRQRRQSVSLMPAALLDPGDAGLGFAGTAQGVGAFVESHTLALIKNPVSSAARLADLGVQTATVMLNLRLPNSTDYPPLVQTNGMDLAKWEKWLNRYTGTRQEEGSIQLLIDGDRFFGRLQQAITEATNHISLNVCIFDRDDVAVGIADRLKQRSAGVPVRVILDQMSSLASGLSPPVSPMPEDFISPGSITGYLRHDSHFHVRPFLNPWFSADHSKVYFVDGTHAWMGGMNLGREYRYEWHDLMFELQGPVVASLENEFKRDWASAGPLGDLGFVIAALSQPKGGPVSPDGDWIKLRRLPTRTLWKPFSAAVQASIGKAQSYIYAENPYLFDKRVITGLVKARNRGVDVRVVLPRANDLGVGSRGNLVTANYLLQHGVRVYFYPGMTHVKAMLVDDWACLGSANLNHMSLRLNQEDNIATSDPAFAARLKHDLFEEDFARSYELQESISVDWVDFMADLILEGF